MYWARSTRTLSGANPVEEADHSDKTKSRDTVVRGAIGGDDPRELGNRRGRLIG